MRTFSIVDQSSARRASSIRTRIKTHLFLHFHMQKQILAEHLPLEQGLRPDTCEPCRLIKKLAEHLPLEQGLRQIDLIGEWDDIRLAEHLPLEQGLRQANNPPIYSRTVTRRASSIRTRIKTSWKTF